MSVYLSRKIYFASAHRYHLDHWSDEKNREIFGPCNNPHGHGHNYELEVVIEGKVDQDTGMVMNLTDLDKILKDKIMKPMDHRFLNYEVEYFKERVPTTENMAVYCFEQIASALPRGSRLHKIKLYENPELYVEYYGETSSL